MKTRMLWMAALGMLPGLVTAQATFTGFLARFSSRTGELAEMARTANPMPDSVAEKFFYAPLREWRGQAANAAQLPEALRKDPWLRDLAEAPKGAPGWARWNQGGLGFYVVSKWPAQDSGHTLCYLALRGNGGAQYGWLVTYNAQGRILDALLAVVNETRDGVVREVSGTFDGATLRLSDSVSGSASTQLASTAGPQPGIATSGPTHRAYRLTRGGRLRP